MENLVLYLKDSYQEFAKKASWPTLTVLQKSTVVVLVSTVIFSLLIFGMDKSISTILEFVYQIFK
jgi:preprotein translocase subunit SecE